jgi:hypothetical protein
MSTVDAALANAGTDMAVTAPNAVTPIAIIFFFTFFTPSLDVFEYSQRIADSH